MCSFLGIIDAAEQCAVCDEPVPAGVAGHTDDVPPQPICYECLLGRDGRLMALLLLVESLRDLSRFMNPDDDPEELSEEVREMLRFIQTYLPAARA